MTNEEKYKTAQKRESAFTQFCSPRDCAECPCLEGRKTAHGCILNWLETEVEEELLPCPFCGGKASTVEMLNGDAVAVLCKGCHTTSRNCNTKEDAISAWNRRSK